MEKLTAEQIKDLSKELNPLIDIPKVPEFLEGWIIRVIISIIDFWLWKKLPEMVYGMYKDLLLMLLEGDEEEKEVAKTEIVAYIPDEFRRV